MRRSLPDSAVYKSSLSPRLAPPAKRWAILIGIDRYENTNISPLIGAANTMLRTT